MQQLPDSLVIYPVNSLCGGVSVQGCGDPRIVMAMAVASLRCTQGLTIEGCECVDELYPGYFDRFRGVTLSR